MKKIAVPNRLRTLLLEKIKNTQAERVSGAAVTALQDYLDEMADTIAQEAADSNYFKVTPLDIKRGISKHELLIVRKFIDKQDSYIGLKISLAEELKRIASTHRESKAEAS